MEIRPDIKLSVERSLSGLYWCVVLNGDRANPIIQLDTKWQAERELIKLTRTQVYKAVA